MRDELHDTAHLQDALQANALDALLSELISQQPSISICETSALETQADTAPLADMALADVMPLNDAPMDASADEDALLAVEQPVEMAQADTTPPPIAMEPEALPDPPQEPLPTRVYSIADLMLFERLTGYRLVVQRQLWRSVDKSGNRAIAEDRLFTVLAEETFQIADRNRRNGTSPHADLSPDDLAAAMKPMRGIAAHLGDRGIQAWDRLEIVVLAALDRRKAA
ncbi:hypothetical protein GAO09_03080 [Rhizobiales bacterium RZME27]|uniref:Uncharacterized protein n=1 Tax=Endobacterium cereale TaxID=2663029 RepID=A0A6A8A1Z7_9HYPH|nr:hypothetical protein [Endobacterium cereale]MEB2844633.1 hypothetical protein [Endobacterium cereale]MQY45052.1 hypothetical protein [Endobacterium cereale]